MNPFANARKAKELARELGFERVGITRAEPLEAAEYYRAWVAAGRGGSMAFLTREIDARADPRLLLPGARSIVCVALNYRRDPSALPANPRTPAGRIAQYARGRDYHDVMRRMLDELIASLRAALGATFEARRFVDTAPILERELARRAGLGWIGKNTCVLNEQLGSCFFLGEVLTTLDLAPDTAVPDHCGNCTRCLDACPTRAFPAPYQLDASRCIAYLTIERRGAIPSGLHEAIGDWVFGCDVCQEVCPFNARAPGGAQPEIMSTRAPAAADLVALLQLTSADYRRLTRNSALRRATRRMWRRNAAIALGNLSDVDPPILAALQQAAEDPDPLVRGAARTALARARHRIGGTT